MFKFEKIVDSSKELFAYEILLKDSSEIDWDTISIDLLNSFTLSQMNLVLSKDIKELDCCANFFINVERKQLECYEFLAELSCLNSLIKNKGFTIYFEVTERGLNISNVDLRMLLDIKKRYDFYFVADDMEKFDVRWYEAVENVYEFIKVEYEIFRTFNRDMLLKINKFDIKVIVERIETAAEFIASSEASPSYYQGYLFK